MKFANNFLSIISKTEFCLAYNQKEKSRYDNIPFNFKGISCIWYFPAKDMLHMLPSVLIRFLLMMHNVLKRMKYLFFELWGTKMTVNFNTFEKKIDFFCSNIETSRKITIFGGGLYLFC